MRVNFRDKIALSGVSVLLIGVVLLIFTFISAYGFLAQSLDIIPSADLVQTFGEALAPLIATAIRIMYLGVMGWVGSLVTIRGVTIIANVPKIEPVVALQRPVGPAPTPVTQKPQPQASPAKVEQPQKEVKPEPKPEAKPPEPQIVVIPPEQIAPQHVQTQPEPPKQQKNDSTSQGSGS
jgi:hypothetical protein